MLVSDFVAPETHSESPLTIKIPGLLHSLALLLLLILFAALAVLGSLLGSLLPPGLQTFLERRLAL